MIVLGIFSLFRIGHQQTQILKRIFQKVQWEGMDAGDFNDFQQCSCELDEQGRRGATRIIKLCGRLFQ